MDELRPEEERWESMESLKMMMDGGRAQPLLEVREHLGELQAWDLNTGKRVWQHNFKTILWAPLLVTGGDVVFAGGTPDREFRAFDARAGNQLWSFPAPAGVIGVPTSFEVDGEWYLAVTAGWGLDAQGTQNGIDKIQGDQNCGSECRHAAGFQASLGLRDH
jgi:outer membrane protein assembly factor BamB